VTPCVLYVENKQQGNTFKTFAKFFKVQMFVFRIWGHCEKFENHKKVQKNMTHLRILINIQLFKNNFRVVPFYKVSLFLSILSLLIPGIYRSQPPYPKMSTLVYFLLLALFIILSHGRYLIFYFLFIIGDHSVPTPLISNSKTQEGSFYAKRNSLSVLSFLIQFSKSQGRDPKYPVLPCQYLFFCPNQSLSGSIHNVIYS